jgi:hypothetical protein
MKGAADTGPRAWSVCAASALPVPLSPPIVAMRKWREVQRICEKSLCMTGLRPTMAPSVHSG